MSTVTFDFNGFLNDSKNTLLNPNSYFSGLKLSGGITEPSLKAAMYGILTGLIYLLCYLLKVRTLGAGYTGEAVGLLAFIKIIFASVAGLFIGAFALLVISSVCRGITAYEANLRVTSSVMVVVPVYTVLSISQAINLYFGIVIGLLIFIYFLWILYHGMVFSLKCKPENARIVGYVLTGIMIIFLLLNLRTSAGQDDLKKVPKKNIKEIRNR
jgi:hypothetical protein